jgi:diphthamide biosynthesis enzyme Dph1/Dph2-like protein
MLVSAAKRIPNLANAVDELAGRLAALQKETGSESKVWVVYEAAYARDCAWLTEQLNSKGIACECGRLPFTADLSRWSLNPEPQGAASDTETKLLHRTAGLEFDAAPGDADVLLYVGTSDSQLLSLNMQHPQQRLIHFDPETDSWTTGTGADIRAYKQRAFAIQVVMVGMSCLGGAW